MRAIISVVGKDKPGILAFVAKKCADNNVNIENLSLKYATKNILPINIPIPENTPIIELILCFTTSVSLEAFIFGYFKLATKPIHEVNKITIKLKIIINII